MDERAKIDEPQREMTLKEACDKGREDCKAIEKLAREIYKNSFFNAEQAYQDQHVEMKEQSMLAVRHLEDARMRLGKVLQYMGDGVSIYDKV